MNGIAATSKPSAQAVAREKAALAAITAERTGKPAPELVPSIDTLPTNQKVKAKMDGLANEILSATAAIKELENQKREASAELQALAETIGVKKFTGQIYTALVKYSGDRATISAEKLIENGVKASVIEASTVVKKGKDSMVVLPRAQKSDETDI